MKSSDEGISKKTFFSLSVSYVTFSEYQSSSYSQSNDNIPGKKTDYDSSVIPNDLPQTSLTNMDERNNERSQVLSDYLIDYESNRKANRRKIKSSSHYLN